MRDIPMFTTQSGVASLTLSQIPYRKTAYIRVHSAAEPESLLRECKDFCNAVGAEKILFTGFDQHNFSVYTDLVQMSRFRQEMPDTDAALFPVQEKNLAYWRSIYNKRMENVPLAEFMTANDANEHLRKGDGYFVHRGENLLGIGVASGERIDVVASVVPGAGEQVLYALNHALSGDRIVVEVATANKLAVRLYEKLGFVANSLISRWYELL